MFRNIKSSMNTRKNYTDLFVDYDEISIYQKHVQFLPSEAFKSTNE